MWEMHRKLHFIMGIFKRTEKQVQQQCNRHPASTGNNSWPILKMRLLENHVWDSTGLTIKWLWAFSMEKRASIFTCINYFCQDKALIF